MYGRLIAGLTIGLLLFVPASLVQALEISSNARTLFAWWVLPVGLAISLFIGLRAPTGNAAWGRLLLLNGLVWLALVPPSLLASASAMQEWFRPEIIDDAAARFVLKTALSGHLRPIALTLALLLIASSLLVLRHGRSGRSKPRD